LTQFAPKEDVYCNYKSFQLIYLLKLFTNANLLKEFQIFSPAKPNFIPNVWMRENYLAKNIEEDDYTKNTTAQKIG
jgi:hypothetical protein